jgi:hypothetical protein
VSFSDWVSADWVSAMANCIVAGSVIYVARQARAGIASAVEAKKQAEIASETLQEIRTQAVAEHERGRRETAVRLLQDWYDRVTPGQPAACYIVERLSVAQCRDMQYYKPLTLPAEHFNRLRTAMSGIPGVEVEDFEEGKDLVLGRDRVFHLGLLCHRYLTSLDVMLIAWLGNTADRETMERQLQFLVKPEQDFYLLKCFRDAMGGVPAYPNIYAFVQRICEIKNAVPPERAPAYPART